LDIPKIAKVYLEQIPRMENPIPVLFIVTGGNVDNCGWAVESGIRILAERGCTIKIGDLIQMPDNWTPFHSAPDCARSEEIVRAGTDKAAALVRRFLAGEHWIKPRNLRRFGPVGSALLRTLFHKRGVFKLWMFFRVNDQCNGCGRCARACPTGSIVMRDGKPVWSVTCEQCMRCLSYCPTRAILQLEGLLHGSRNRANRLPGFDPFLDARGKAVTTD
jgi:ferredoxin